MHSRNLLGKAWVKSILLILILTWSILISMVMRPVVTLSQYNQRDPQQLLNAATLAIGSGEHTVFVPYEFYHAGCMLGWKMYADAFSLPRPVLDNLSEPRNRRFFNRIDHVLSA